MDIIKKCLWKIAGLCIITAALLLPQDACADSHDDFLIENGKLLAYDGTSNEIMIPDDVTTIGDHAFSNCDSITSVTIPNSVSSIESYAFSNCSSLTSITIPGTVAAIEDGAFFCCSSLTSITIQNGVTSLGYGTFWGCSSLTSLTIPSSLIKIDGGAPSLFGSDCMALKEITAEEGNEKYETRDGVLLEKTSSGLELALYPAGKKDKSYTIPDDVTTIGNAAFEFSRNLIFVTIPEGVTKIGANAFSYSRRFTSVTIPETVTSIGSGAFSYCKRFTSVTIPRGITSIKYRTFYSCPRLKHLKISNRVKSIGYDAFFYCDNLTNLELDAATGRKIKIKTDPNLESGKVTITSSGKGIAPVSKKGMITPKKKGTEIISIKYIKNKKVLARTQLSVTVK